MTKPPDDATAHGLQVPPVYRLLAIVPPPERFDTERNSGIIRGRCAERQLKYVLPG